VSAPATDPRELLALARAGDRRALGRLLTQVEDGTPAARALLPALPTDGPRAHVVGITGPPGAGKSSLVNALVTAIRDQGRTVAVLAVDPSSPITGGAILGDRVRMQQHAQDPGVFIRSMASRGQGGGLAAATHDAAMVLARVGFDTVLIETVGAGQGEVAVAGITDTTIVVEAPGMGDEVQALKAGLMEMAHIVVVSKADMPGADQAAAALRAMLTVGAQHDRAMGDRPHPRRPEVLLASSTEGTGIAELLAAIDRRRPSTDDPASASVSVPGASSVDASKVELRALSEKDDRVVFGILRRSLDDMLRRQGHAEGWPFDPADDAEWARWRPVYEHVRTTAELAVGAELDGRLIGYARTISRGDARELTELFVLPEAQGAGVGTRLLDRTFTDDGRPRTILASRDPSALSRYLRIGLVHSTTIHTFEGPPAADPMPLPPDVSAVPMERSDANALMDDLADVDAVVLGVRRDVDHRWLGATRVGWTLVREGSAVGYVYAGRDRWTETAGAGFQGPIAVVDPTLVAGAIGLIEAHARANADPLIELEIPLANRVAVRYLLDRGYRIDPGPYHLLEDPPRILADRYLVMSPPFHV
jgi:LAO/AO transport system kinase